MPSAFLFCFFECSNLDIMEEYGPAFRLPFCPFIRTIPDIMGRERRVMALSAGDWNGASLNSLPPARKEKKEKKKTKKGKGKKGKRKEMSVRLLRIFHLILIPPAGAGGPFSGRYFSRSIALNTLPFLFPFSALFFCFPELPGSFFQTWKSPTFRPGPSLCELCLCLFCSL